MKTATIISILAASASGLALPTEKRDVPTIFLGMSLRSGTPVHFADIQANGRFFYLNKPTSTYCPSEVTAIDCSAYGNNTIFAGGQDTLSMDVAVAGGQQAFVNADGALAYTAPHSADTGTGSYVSGFGNSADTGLLTFDGENWLACHLEDDVYQVYAASVTDAALASTCIAFQFAVHATTGTAAYEYA